MAKNHVFHNKTKHIDIQCHFLQDLVQQGLLEIAYCNTKEQVANTFTKALPKDKLYNSAMNLDSPQMIIMGEKY